MTAAVEDQKACSSRQTEIKHKPSKRGIIYLSSIPPYMNVTKIKELFNQYGKVGRVYLQLFDKGSRKHGTAALLHKCLSTTTQNVAIRILCGYIESTKPGEKEKKKRKTAKKFTEGWVEFEKKCVAKRVTSLLNNTQVSMRKKSKHYDCIWNIKYLSNFKWTHLHERLAYERAARSKKLKAEIQLAKKKTNFFTANLDKKKKDKVAGVNREFENINEIGTSSAKDNDDQGKESRNEFLQSLFS